MDNNILGSISMSNIPDNIISMSDEDKDYLISASNVVESIFNCAKLDQRLGLMTEEKRNNIMKQTEKLMIPPSIRNTRADDLRGLVTNSYIEESILIMREKAGKKQRSCVFQIKKEDEDLIEELTQKWHLRCVGVVRISDESTDFKKYVDIKLSW